MTRICQLSGLSQLDCLLDYDAPARCVRANPKYLKVTVLVKGQRTQYLSRKKWMPDVGHLSFSNLIVSGGSKRSCIAF